MSGQEMHKEPVEKRNIQPDGESYIFAPDLFFKRIGGVVTKIDPAKSKYVWVQHQIPKITPLEIYRGDDRISVLEVIRSKLEQDHMDDKFVCFLLFCGKS